MAMTPNGVVSYIANSLAWSFVGAGTVLMYQLGANQRTMKTPRVNWPGAVSMVVLLVAVVSTVVSWETDRRQRSFVTCQAAVNQTRTEALNRITSLASEDRKAVDALVRSVIQSKTRADSAAALQEYLATRARTDAQREKEGPLPQPNDLCGNQPAQ